VSSSSGPACLPVEALYREHHDWLRAWLWRRLGCPERAADFAHESYLRVLLRPPAEPLDCPRAFLTRIATRLLIDDGRRARLERAWLEVQGQARAADPGIPSAETVTEWLDTLEWVARLVADLPDKPRRAFLMSRLDGLAQAQIAAELGVSISMVKKYMAQALLHCQRALDEGPGRG